MKRIYKTDRRARKVSAKKAKVIRDNAVARDKAYFAVKRRRTHWTPGALQRLTPEKFVKAVETVGFRLTITGHRNHV